MMESMSKELLLKKLREYLNAEKIKLWLPPHTKEDQTKGEVPEALITRLSEQLRYQRDEVAEGLEQLRLHALAKLAERAKFNSQGVATLRVKLTCPLPVENAPRKPMPVECSLEITGADLKNLIGNKFNVSPGLLRLISGGKVLDEQKSLLDQGVKLGSDVMAMCMTSSEAKIAQREAEIVEVKKTRNAALLLSSREEDDEHFDVQIADQKGQPLKLPREEKKALTLAMTLHEKGRSALKTKKVSLALPLLLEADQEFNKCRAEILQSVDNYAILCLDIVWCYFLLKNLDQLPNAEMRLTSSEACFKRCYGEKMERLAAIKGGTGMEQALFMRLYLLQGIVAFHKGETSAASNLFRRAEFVLNLLHVDEDKLSEVMLMGFTEREARLGLRARSGNVQLAVDHIMEKKKEREDINKRVKSDWHQRVRAKKLGKTASGEPVNVSYYDSLLGMEIPPGAAAESLRRANNSINAALEILSANPDLLSLPDPENKKVEITDAMMQQLLALGFDVDVARSALQQFHGNIQKAVDELLKNNGFLPPTTGSSSSSPSSSSSSDTASRSVSESSLTDSSSPEAEEEKKRRKKEKEELESLVADIATDENDHLDLTLTEERDILTSYQMMIASLPQQA